MEPLTKVSLEPGALNWYWPPPRERQPPTRFNRFRAMVARWIDAVADWVRPPEEDL